MTDECDLPGAVMSTVCPRAAGRSPWRRRKNCVILGLAMTVLFGFAQLVHFEDDYSPLHPLSDAQSEAQRLLKMITHYQYQCNSTLQYSNRTYWPLCTDRDVGIDVDSRDTKILYYIGSPKSSHELRAERGLALNHSFHVYVISPTPLHPAVRLVNNTRFVQTQLVPNDPADFSRNSYGQQTINDLMRVLGHASVDVVRLDGLAPNVPMWEFIHFMIYDNLLLNVRQLHIAMYIDKIDSDLLYNWYRALYEIFDKEGFRLYHTNSADSLCLQVTMMQTCVYYMSWIRVNSPRVFILQPPAHLGSEFFEQQRLLSYLSQPDIHCKQQLIGGRHEASYTAGAALASRQSIHHPSLLGNQDGSGMPEWAVCLYNRYHMFQQPCWVVRIRSGNDHYLEKRFLNEGCNVLTVEPMTEPAAVAGYTRNQMPRTYTVHTHHVQATKELRSDVKSLEEVMTLLSTLSHIRLLELDVQNYEWVTLTHMLDTGLLQNVTQLVMDMRLQSSSDLGNRATTYRHHYSELVRIGAQRMQLFTAQPSTKWSRATKMRSTSQEQCCYKIGFVRNDMLS